MFGILEKMDKFSSAQMSEGEQLNFIQELIDNNMVWEMHKKYRDQAEIYLNADSALLPEEKNPNLERTWDNRLVLKA
tara:strand:+ start:885 stop:1115 length:231 start_codon:yes stop_codon:yes gene_type:complete